MSDRPTSPRPEHEDGVPPGLPVWVKALGLVVLVVALLLLVGMLVFGGEHGPGRHSG